MWGRGTKSSPGGYTDTVYRSRQSGGFESKSRCCCFYFTRSVIILFLLTLLLAAGGLSVVSVVFGYSQRWTYNVNRKVSPAYAIRTGWLYFSDNRMQSGARSSLRQLSKALYILGIICLVLNGLSAIFALFFGIRALCGRVGRGFICFSIPYSILLIAAMGAYYLVAALEVWKWQDRLVGTSRVAWPDWAWALGAGAALAWFVAAGLASVLPRRHKYLDAEEEFRPSRATRESSSDAPAQRTPVNLTPRPSPYVPSSPEPAMPESTLTQPLAAQENPAAAEDEGRKKSFVPSWGRKSTASSTSGGGVLPFTDTSNANESAFNSAPAGSYRTRAEEIANRYKNRNVSPETAVELAPTAPSHRLGAW